MKNIRLFEGKPILLYPLGTASESKLFSEIMVSTDDQAIADVAQAHGASVPFLRSERNSDDHATIADVVTEVLAFYDKQGRHFDNICCLLPTAVFISVEIIQEAYLKMQQEGLDSIFPVQRFTYPIERALWISKASGKVKMIHPENLRARSQDLPDSYHDCGQFYWARTEAFKREGAFFGSNAGYVELSPLYVHDIDVEEDWEMAEYKFKVLNDIKKF